jgi:hypothetical protein
MLVAVLCTSTQWSTIVAVTVQKRQCAALTLSSRVDTNAVRGKFSGNGGTSFSVCGSPTGSALPGFPIDD